MTDRYPKLRRAFRVTVVALLCGAMVALQLPIPAAIGALPGSPFAVMFLGFVIMVWGLLGVWWFRGGVADPAKAWNRPEFIVVRFALPIAWGTYLTGYFRSWDIGGPKLLLLGIAGLLMNPLFGVAVAGLSLRGMLIGTFLVLLAVGLMVEVPIAIEEAGFRRRSESAGTMVFQTRWWPFDGFTLAFDPETGRYWVNC